MTENNPRQDVINWRDLQNDKLDRELDAALARFGAVEPRPGLDERILATLRAERERSTERSWWRWPAVAALVVMIALSVSLAWRSANSAKNTAAHTAVAAQSARHSPTQVANNRGGLVRPHAASGRQLKPHSVSSPAKVLASPPKLEQFPSPQPLSEQEKLLSAYVSEHRKQAALV